MAKPVNTEAICLQTRNWRESSKIVTILCQELGLVNAIARGARRPKHGFGAALDLFVHSQVVLYLRENWDLAVVGSAELLNAHSGIVNDYQRFVAAATLVSFIKQIVLRNHSEPKVFQLLKSSLEVLSTNPVQGDFSALIGSFIIKTTTFLGFRPMLERCVFCYSSLQVLEGDGQSLLGFDLIKGGVVCPDCRSRVKERIGVADLILLKRLLLTPVAQLVEEKISPRMLKLLNNYAAFHLRAVKGGAFVSNK